MRGSGFKGFRGFRRGGAAHIHMEAPRSFRIMVFTKDGKPVNLLNLLNLLTHEDSYKGKMVIFCFHTSWWWQLRCHIYEAIPEGKWIAGFPFGVFTHRPLSREWQRFLASLEMTIRSSVLQNWHTDRCVEGCLFEAHPSCAFGAPLLQGATRIK